MLTTFQSDSEEETSEDAENRKAQENANKPTAPPSGATTPSGRKEKSQGGLSDRDGVSKKSLKRPGSPNLSDAGSGTDTSTRKRPKTKHLSSTQPTPTVSRPTSPANAPPSSAPQKLKIRSGAGSDTDGANLSDVSRRKKLKKSGQGGTSSRAGSPGPNMRPNMPSRPASTANQASSTTISMPTLDEIRDRIIQSLPEGGMTVPQFINTVPHPKDRGKEFIRLTMQVAKAATTEDGRKILVLRDEVGGAPAEKA